MGGGGRMKCKNIRCKREIPENSIFCPWCGTKQIAEARELKVPPPKHNGKSYYNQITIDGERTYISGSSEDEYYAKARAAKAKLIEIKKSRPKLTLGTAIDNYIKDNSVLSPSTINAYKSYRKTRFQRYMDYDVAAIPYQRMISEESKSLKPKTVHNAWRLVTASLSHAGEEVPTVNLPQKVKSDRQWLDYEQIELFCKVLYGKPYELGALLALNGLRRSELLYLSSDDIDLKAGIIHVRGAAVIGLNNKLTDKQTNKNQTSTRDVHIVIPRLTELLSGKKGRLITTNPTTLYGLINGLCKKNGLPEVGVHGLRHSFASLAYHLKWSESTTMREGGWANTETVHRIYTHLASQDADADIQKMQQFYAEKTHAGQFT
jgi:integrase